jgi:tRNA(Ile)-lysidine synthase
VSDRTDQQVERPVELLTRQSGPLVLAVSGGLDSMALLHAAARVCRDDIAVVATFDHGTSPAAAAAAAHVAGAAAELRLPVVIGRARRIHRDEAGWREERWRFLREVAAASRGTIVTAHTEDDHVETVLMRAMRGAGARGLAALHAPSAGIARPFLGVTRSAISAYAERHGIDFIDDPTNRSMRHFRNRVRLEILPALLAVRPTLRAELIAVSTAAARWRSELDLILLDLLPPLRAGSARHRVAAGPLTQMEPASLRVVLPALLGRAGIAMDRRGIDRLATFVRDSRVGLAVPISGGWSVRRLDAAFEIARSHDPPPPARLTADESLRWGEWEFRPAADDGSVWSATLPAGGSAVVRSWRPGDRMGLDGGTLRRVKRLLTDAGIQGSRREGWPVVVVDGEVRWIPGVRRSDAATARSGGPGASFQSERSHG